MTVRHTRCPGCRSPAKPRGENPAWPFCSDRCRLADLGRWLGEEYRIPGPRAGDGPPDPAAPEEDGP
jgi:hypothetical protein